MGNRNTLATNAIMINCILLIRSLGTTCIPIFFVINVKNVLIKVITSTVSSHTFLKNTLKLHLSNASFVVNVFTILAIWINTCLDPIWVDKFPQKNCEKRKGFWSKQKFPDKNRLTMKILDKDILLWDLASVNNVVNVSPVVFTCQFTSIMFAAQYLSAANPVVQT